MNILNWQMEGVQNRYSLITPLKSVKNIKICHWQENISREIIKIYHGKISKGGCRNITKTTPGLPVFRGVILVLNQFYVFCSRYEHRAAMRVPCRRHAIVHILIPANFNRSLPATTSSFIRRVNFSFCFLGFSDLAAF
jgi:hypothetical protein